MYKSFQEINEDWRNGALIFGEVVSMYMEAITPENFVEALELIPDEFYDEFIDFGHWVCTTPDEQLLFIAAEYPTNKYKFHPELRTLLGKYLGYVFEE